MLKNKIIKNKYLIFSVLAVIIAIFTYLYWVHIKNISVRSSDNSTNLPDISVPAGWQSERTSFSQIIFTHNSGGPFLDRIEVDALKINKTLDQQIVDGYDRIPGNVISSTYIGWSGMPMEYSGGSRIPVGWATINGNLILVSNDKETDFGTVLDYSIFNNGVIYMFSTPYQFYNPVSKTFVTKYPEVVKTLQKMVEDFVKSLPSGISQ